MLDLRRAGIRHLLVISGHGGNFILGPAIQSLLLEFPEMRIALSGEDWPNEEGGRPIFDLSAPDIHAGEIETSLVLALFPDLVGDERVDDVPDAGREFLDYVTLDRLSENGVWGRPSAGDAEKGRRALAVQTRRIVDFARRSFRGQP